MPDAGFTLGDHTFLHPSQTGPMSRFSDKKRQIRGAACPAFLDAVAREAGKDSAAAKELFKGKFCGHGEPTMTIFDVVIDGSHDLEVTGFADEQTEEGANLLIFLARAAGSKGDWRVLFRREWEENQAMLDGVEAEYLPHAEVAEMEPDIATVRVSIGFEYPCDAQSRDDASWMTIDILDSQSDEPACVVNAELA
jgi:hypothetical protein